MEPTQGTSRKTFLFELDGSERKYTTNKKCGLNSFRLLTKFFLKLKLWPQAIWNIAWSATCATSQLHPLVPKYCLHTHTHTHRDFLFCSLLTTETACPHPRPHASYHYTLQMTSAGFLTSYVPISPLLIHHLLPPQFGFGEVWNGMRLKRFLSR